MTQTYDVQLLTRYGWECVDAHDNRADAIASRDNYRDNDPTGTYRWKRVSE